MLNRPPVEEVLQSLSMGSALPKIIHQTFPTKTLPAELQANIDALKRLNPDWRHVLYDDDDIKAFIYESYGADVFHRFDQIEPIYGAARADLFRYLLLYKHGGVYLDIKSTATRPLSAVLRDDERFIISQWPHGADAIFRGAGQHLEVDHVPYGEYQQWFLVSVAGHAFLKSVIENIFRNLQIYNPVLHSVGKRGVLRLTGPIAFTLAIHPIIHAHPHRRADATRDLGISYSVYPMVDNVPHQHLHLFQAHYSQTTCSIVRLYGANATLMPVLLRWKANAKALLKSAVEHGSQKNS